MERNTTEIYSLKEQRGLTRGLASYLDRTLRSVGHTDGSHLGGQIDTKYLL
jgi:hypothetical protein